MNPPIDPDKPETWPEAVHLLTKTISTRLNPASDTSASDLSHCTTAEQDIAWEHEIRTAMTGRRLLAYHATRLLPEEADWISNEGILPLTRDLIDRKIGAAKSIHPELIDDKLSQRMREGGPLNWQGTADVRLGSAWIFTPLSLVNEQPSGFSRFLQNWGGEAISWTDDASLGEPIAIISETAIPTIIKLTVSPAAFRPMSTLWTTFVGRYLGLDSIGRESPAQQDLLAANILSFITPTDTRWPTAARY